MKFKLSKLNLFLIIIAVLIASTLGFTIKEYFENPSSSQPPTLSLSQGNKYDPFSNSKGKHDPLGDADYSKTIAGLEDIVIPGRGTNNHHSHKHHHKHHHDEDGNHYPGAHDDDSDDDDDDDVEKKVKKEEKKLEKELFEEDRIKAEGAGIDMSKYILKSEIVPPVCPKCPDARTCPREKKCPPCPPCARCPESPFMCKKVPNYNAISASGVNGQLPMPRLNSFAQFN